MSPWIWRRMHLQLTHKSQQDFNMRYSFSFGLWCLTSNYVENFFAQFKLFLNRGSRKEALVFLNTFQTYVVTYQDRVFQTQRFGELLDELLTDYSLPPTLGYRQYFDPHGSLRISWLVTLSLTFPPPLMIWQFRCRWPLTHLKWTCRLQFSLGPTLHFILPEKSNTSTLLLD